MKNLEDIKMKNIKNLLITGIGVVGLALAVGLNGCRHAENGNQKFTKTDGKDYVSFWDYDDLMYIDLGKDGSLDIFYNIKEFPIVTEIKIVDSAYATKSDSKIINRREKRAVDLQKQFEDCKIRYDEALPYDRGYRKDNWGYYSK